MKLQAHLIRVGICDTYHLLQQGKSDDLCYLLDQKDTLVDQGEANCESQKAHISPIHDQSVGQFQLHRFNYCLAQRLREEDRSFVRIDARNTYRAEIVRSS